MGFVFDGVYIEENDLIEGDEILEVLGPEDVDDSDDFEESDE